MSGERGAGERKTAAWRSPDDRLPRLIGKSTSLINGIKQGRRPKRPAVDLGVAETRYGVEMFARRVTLVMIESVTGITRVQLAHQAIARDLGND